MQMILLHVCRSMQHTVPLCCTYGEQVFPNCTVVYLLCTHACMHACMHSSTRVRSVLQKAHFLSHGRSIHSIVLRAVNSRFLTTTFVHLCVILSAFGYKHGGYDNRP